MADEKLLTGSSIRIPVTVINKTAGIAIKNGGWGGGLWGGTVLITLCLSVRAMCKTLTGSVQNVYNFLLTFQSILSLKSVC